MALETYTGIWSFNSANPVGATDMVAQGANHLRGIKAALLLSFPAVTGIVTVSHTDLNTVTLKANALNAQLTGTPVAPTATAGSNNSQVANTEFVTTACAALVAGTLVDSLVKKGKLMFYSS